MKTQNDRMCLTMMPKFYRIAAAHVMNCKENKVPRSALKRMKRAFHYLTKCARCCSLHDAFRYGPSIKTYAAGWRSNAAVPSGPHIMEKPLVHLLKPKEFRVWCRPNEVPDKLTVTTKPSKVTCAVCLGTMRRHTTGRHKPFKVTHTGRSRSLPPLCCWLAPGPSTG